LLAVIVIALGFRTVVRNRDWKDNKTLFSAQLRNAPQSLKTHHAVAILYMDDRRFDLARKELDLSLQIYPNNAGALATYGVLETWQGNYVEAGRKLEKALDLMERGDPLYGQTAVSLAGVYMKTGHMNGALDLLNREIAQSPSYGRAWAIRAVVHYKLGDVGSARHDAQTALHLDAADVPTRQALHEIGF
jgi:Tfp pilus assembly protein PilF